MAARLRHACHFVILALALFCHYAANSMDAKACTKEDFRQAVLECDYKTKTRKVVSYMLTNW